MNATRNREPLPSFAFTIPGCVTSINTSGATRRTSASGAGGHVCRRTHRYPPNPPGHSRRTHPIATAPAASARSVPWADTSRRLLPSFILTVVSAWIALLELNWKVHAVRHRDPRVLRPELAAQRAGFERYGYVIVRGAIDSGWCRRLHASTRVLPYSVLDPQVGRVRQRGALAVAELSEAAPALQRLGLYLRASMRPLLVGSGGSTDWPNEVAVLRMQCGDGISRHRDRARHEFLVATVNVAGTAEFWIDPNPSHVDGDDRTYLTVSSGDVVVLKGGPGGRRPTHAVEARGDAERVSITFRYDGALAPFPTPQDPDARGTADLVTCR